jgi:photosystem II stability/assembly factor-like uncharacterized protein
MDKTLRAFVLALSVTTLLGLGWLVLGASQPAWAAPPATATIQGRARAEDGGPIKDVVVFSIRWVSEDRGRWIEGKWAYVDASGLFTLTTEITSDPADQYSLFFRSSSESITPFFPGYTLPYSYSLAEGEVRTVDDAVLPVGGFLTGDVRDRFTGLPSLDYHEFDLIRQGAHPITVSFYASGGHFSHYFTGNATLIGDYYLLSNGVLYKDELIQVAPRTITTVTLRTDNPFIFVESVLTVPGMPNVIGIAPPGNRRVLLSQNAGAIWQSIPFPTVDVYGTPYPYTAQPALTRRAQNDASIRVLLFNPANYPTSGPPLRSGDWGATYTDTVKKPLPCEGIPYVGGEVSGDSNLLANGIISPRNSQRLYALGICSRYSGSGLILESYTYPQLYVSDDYGVTWQRRYTPTAPYHSLLWTPSLTEEDRIFLLETRFQKQHTLFDTRNAGKSWITRTLSFTESFTPYQIVADGGSTNTLYVIGEHDEGPRRFGDVFRRSDDAGATWIDSPLPPECVVVDNRSPNLYAVPSETNLLLMRCTTAIYRSRDGGMSWQKLAFAGRGVFVDYANPGRIYLEKYKDLWASDDEGDNWRPVWNVPGTHKQFIPIIVNNAHHR